MTSLRWCGLLWLGAFACAPSGPGASSAEHRATAAVVTTVRVPFDVIADAQAGQLDFVHNTLNLLEGKEFNLPDGIALDWSVRPPRLYVTDISNNRVLAWESTDAFTSGAPAALALGQKSVTQGSPSCAAASASSLCGPHAVTVDGAGNVYVADSSFHRVVEYDAPFATDTVADRVLGQASFTKSSANRGGAVSPASLSSPKDVALDASGRLFVADFDNNRVLRYDHPLTDTTASLALGQLRLSSASPNSPDSQGLNGPTRVALDLSANPIRVYVADSGNHRVLLWNNLSTYRAGDPADKVLGQPDFTSVDCNQGHAQPSASSLCSPHGIWVDDVGNLFVADTDNNRVLGYLSPATTDARADFVWGQPQGSFTSRICGNFTQPPLADGGVDATTPLCQPYDLAWHAGSLLVADTGNNRVLRFVGGMTQPQSPPVASTVYGQDTVRSGNSCNRSGSASATTLCAPRGVGVDSSGIPTIADTLNHRVLRYSSDPNNIVAQQVFGQNGDMTTTSPNAGQATPNATTLSAPTSVISDYNGNVWVGDSGNFRTLGFSINPLDATADIVLGQPDMSNTTCSTPSATCIPQGQTGLAADLSANLYVADRTGNRVLRFPTPFSSPTPPTANLVFGQQSYASTSPNHPDSMGLYKPQSVQVDAAGHLYVTDLGNNRVLSWPDVNTVGMGAGAVRVFGQPDFNTSIPNSDPLGRGPGTLSNPEYLSLDGAGNLYVADESNDRVLEYLAPYATGASQAAAVFGQPNMTAVGCGGAGPLATTLCHPRAVTAAPDGTLYVSDTNDYRVLRYPPGASATPDGGIAADGVLGQADFVAASQNRVDGRGLAGPSGVAVDFSSNPARVYVADRLNNRVLGWKDTLSFAQGAPADVVLGQPNFETGANTATLLPTALTTLNLPQGVGVDPQTGDVYVADTGSHRVVRYRAPYTSDGGVDVVLGQTDFTSRFCNRGSAAPAADTLCNPSAVAVSATGQIFVADASNHRVLEFDTPVHSGASASAVYGQLSFTSRSTNVVGAASASTLKNPNGLAVDFSVTPNRLYVADTDNNRVLGYDAPSLSNNVADYVLGQQDFIGTNGSNGPSRFSGPLGVAVDPLGNVYVSDTNSSRVVQFLTPTTTDFVADQVYGQPNFFTSGCNSAGAPSASTLCSPRGIATDPTGALYAADVSNNRVVAYLSDQHPVPTVSIQPATPHVNTGMTGSYVYHDAEGDPEQSTTFEWLKEGIVQPALTNSRTVPASLTQVGEHWALRVTSCEASGCGVPVVVNVTILPINHPPVPKATPPEGSSVRVGATVNLDASGSSDADGATLSYRWSIVAFPSLSTAPLVASAGLRAASFVPTAPGPYTVRLDVSDGELTTTLQLHLLATASSSGCSSAGAASAAPWLALALLGLGALRRRRVLPLLGALWLVGVGEAQASRRPPPNVPPTTRADSDASKPPSANPALDEARRLYLDFQLDKVVPKLAEALEAPNVTRAETFEIYKLMAFTHAAFDDAVKAEADFTRILELAPDYPMPENASPKVRAYFTHAQKVFREKQAVRLVHLAPRATPGGASSSVDVAVTSGASRVAEMTLHFRLRGSGGYSQRKLERGDGDVFSAPVPTLFPVASGVRWLEYFIRARGRSGELLTQLGDELHPFAIQVNVTEAVAAAPFYKGWPFWTAVGAVAVSAVTLPFLVHNNVNASPGTLGKETLR